MEHLHSVVTAAILVLSMIGCSGTGTEVIVPSESVHSAHYKGEAVVLVAVEGNGERAVRYLEISTAEEPEGYKIYFHDAKPASGLIGIKIKAPSTHVKLTEYSLTGYYGCSRGKRGYGYAVEEIAHTVPGKVYFLTTINTNMNTTYDRFPQALVSEAKRQYGYIPPAQKGETHHYFKNSIVLKRQ